AEDTAVYYCAR
nr:immunoglobulin heavy chain junction region [Homo sapiens]